MEDETRIAVLETNMSHIAKRVDDIAETQKSIQQLILQESRNRHDIEALQGEKREIKAEIDRMEAGLEEFRKDVYSSLKTISEAVNGNSLVSKAILGITGIVAGAALTAIINLWFTK